MNTSASGIHAHLWVSEEAGGGEVGKRGPLRKMWSLLVLISKQCLLTYDEPLNLHTDPLLFMI